MFKMEETTVTSSYFNFQTTSLSDGNNVILTHLKLYWSCKQSTWHLKQEVKLLAFLQAEPWGFDPILKRLTHISFHSLIQQSCWIRHAEEGQQFRRNCNFGSQNTTLSSSVYTTIQAHHFCAWEKFCVYMTVFKTVSVSNDVVHMLGHGLAELVVFVRKPHIYSEHYAVKMNSGE